MTRYLVGLEYDGTAYAGWQRQNNGPSVQAALEDALTKATGRPCPVTGASRTDAGVHALGQAAHFDSDTSIPPEKLPFAVNRFLPTDIRVTAAKTVPDGFNARFHAVGKSYSYIVYNGRHAPALMRGRCAFVPGALDAGNMQDSAREFIGTHDFSCAMAQNGGAKTTTRTVYGLSVAERGPWIGMYVTGNGFLYNMVRILAGTLIMAGQGKLSREQITQALVSGDRTLLGPTAPACGLTLMRVYYGEIPPDLVENTDICDIILGAR